MDRIAFSAGAGRGDLAVARLGLEVHWLLMDFPEHFPPQPYEFRMGLRRGDAAEFFKATADHAEIAAERRRWISEDPAKYVATRSNGAPLIAELAALCREWRLFSDDEEREVSDAKDAHSQLQALGRCLEPDFLLLAPDATGEMRLQAGCVCFPSSWQLEEKIGRPMLAIHEPAPGLNEELGANIEKFLSRLQPGVGWLRSNWGLSASPERNQHPARKLPRLDAGATLDRTWLRVERQALIALPVSGGVLFGIRIESLSLDELRRIAPDAAPQLANALRTMPEEVARYKGLATARLRIAELLVS